MPYWMLAAMILLCGAIVSVYLILTIGVWPRDGDPEPIILRFDQHAEQDVHVEQPNRIVGDV